GDGWSDRTGQLVLRVPGVQQCTAFSHHRAGSPDRTPRATVQPSAATLVLTFSLERRWRTRPWQNGRRTGDRRGTGDESSAHGAYSSPLGSHGSASAKRGVMTALSSYARPDSGHHRSLRLWTYPH